jgi:tetratricopeptide (TPR) repeat protein
LKGADFMDLNQEIRSFEPIDMNKFSNNNKMTDSVRLYNNAIEYLKTGSEDIAMIELKKAVSANPDFYEAVNLLGLCYAYTNQTEKAQELFDKVIQGENNAIKAADYLNFISVGDNISAKKTKNAVNRPAKTVQKKEPAPIGSYSEENVQPEYALIKKLGAQLKKPVFAAVLNVISLACLVTALVLFFLASPTTSSKKETQNSKPAAGTKQSSKNNLKEENEALKKQLDAANLKLSQIQISADISQIYDLYGQAKYVEASDKLKAIQVSQLSPELKTKYDAIKQKAYSAAASQLTNDGNTLYRSGKYPEAIQSLEKVFTLGDNWPFGDKALYILGKSCVEANQNQKAAEAYQKLISQYPNSGYVRYAKDRLKAIQ